MIFYFHGTSLSLEADDDLKKHCYSIWVTSTSVDIKGKLWTFFMTATVHRKFRKHHSGNQTMGGRSDADTVNQS